MSVYRDFVKEFQHRPENAGMTFAQALTAVKVSGEWEAYKAGSSKEKKTPASSSTPIDIPRSRSKVSAEAEKKLTYTENIAEVEQLRASSFTSEAQSAAPQKGRMTKKKKLEAEIKANERRLELLRLEMELIEQKRK